MAPNLIFGGASIGASYDDVDAVKELLAGLKSLNITRIDTAARYPPTKPGASENLLGEANAASAGFTIDTKVKCEGDGAGSLKASAIEQSVTSSKKALHTQKIHVLHCHRPDLETPLEEQAAALNEEHEKGNYQELGISNFSPDMVEKYIDICNKHGYVKPTVYQGQYNIICRNIETTLFPVLHKHGIKFNAFSPLAGGFLTGKMTSGETHGTRFASGDVMGQFFAKLYDKQEVHDAMRSLFDTLKPHDISGPEAGLRWICFHSALKAQDGVILGASKFHQLESNVNAIQKGALPNEVVAALEKVWDLVKDVAP